MKLLLHSAILLSISFYVAIEDLFNRQVKILSLDETLYSTIQKKDKEKLVKHCQRSKHAELRLATG